MLNKRAGKTTLQAITVLPDQSPSAQPAHEFAQPPYHCRTKEAYPKTLSSPAETVLLNRLQAGHTHTRKAYANQLDTTNRP